MNTIYKYIHLIFSTYYSEYLPTWILMIATFTCIHTEVYSNENLDSLMTIQLPDIPTDTIATIHEELPCMKKDSICSNDSIDIDYKIIEQPPKTKKFQFAIKSNLLYDAVLVPNIGLEFHLAKRWSIGADFMYAKWKSDRHLRYWCVSGAEINARHYLGGNRNGVLSGHHLGFYGQIGSYDFELGGDGQKSDRCYGAGIEYGYSMKVAKRINIDFGIGFGYFGGVYEKYKPMDGHYVWEETHRRNWIGPTRVEVSLVWLIG